MKDQIRRGGQSSVSLASSASQEPAVLTINSDENSSEGSDVGEVKSKEVIVDSSSSLEIPDDEDLEVERAVELDARQMDDPRVELNDIHTTDISRSSAELMHETDSHLEDEGRCEVMDEEKRARSTSDETTMEVEDNFDAIIFIDVKEDKRNTEANEDDGKQPMPYSCPATRTRSWFGRQPRVSYRRYFETLDSDGDEEEEEEEEEEEDESQEDEPLSSSKKKMFSKTSIPREDEPLSSFNKKNKFSKPQKDAPSSSSNKKSSEPQTDEPSSLLNSAKSGKRKRDIPSKKYFIPELLVNTMCSKAEDIPSNSPKNLSCNEEPDFLSWDDEELKIVEKSDHEKFIDQLWADFDFAMGSMNIGYYNADKQSQEEKITENMEDRPLSSCSSRKHCFILDEQVGIICKFCSCVNVEIRHILPSFAQNMFRKSEMRNSNSEQDQLHFENLHASINLNGEASTSSSRKTVWDLIPGVYKTMYQHQQEAFEFMWRNLAGGIDLNKLISHSKPDVVGGCVISHAPGTGKTRLSIIFIQTYMKVFPDCRPMIIAPRGMLLTWETEARKWDVNIPIHNLNSSEYTGMEDKVIISLTSGQPRTKMLMRLVKLCSWSKGNSILGVSYNLFKTLSSERTTGLDKFLLEKPGLLVLDEGHIPRNQRSLIWKVLGKVKSEKRLILSGTPFQNNFDELYNILCLVRPKFADEITNNNLKFERQKLYVDKQQIGLPEKDGGKEIWTSLTSNVTDDNVEEVRSILKPFVHIHNGTILNDLPGMREYIIVLDPVSHQKAIIEKVKHIGSKSCLDSEYKYCLASIHPSLVTYLKMSKEEEFLVEKDLLEKLKLNPAEGAKTRFVVEIVRLCESQNEKVLIFSQYIQPLTMIKEQLINEFNLIEGKEVLEITGKVHLRNRQSSINIFNDEKSEAKVLLASTKACCEGISLTGASRVILIDVVWNPAVGRQAISRAYRIGQKKFVYTYNLITSGTGEKEKYDAQIKKDHLSKLLFAQESESTSTKIRLPQSKEGHLNSILSKDKILEQIVDKMKGTFIDIFCSSKEYST